jgi:hypothetical protein
MSNDNEVVVQDVQFYAPEKRASGGGGGMAIATTKAAQEVQAAIVMAKQCPRDQDAAFARIIAACKRRTLADAATYGYKRGGSEVTGPSIRLAEEIARNWGNLDVGFTELDQSGGRSSVQAYAWDLETNTRITRVFEVPHVRHTKGGTYPLTDPRDIYEAVANQAARRMRACILAAIPGDVVEAAVAQCEKTLTSGHAKPLRDRVRDAIALFAGIGVGKAQIEAKIQHSVDSMTERELLSLGKVFNGIRDGYATVEEAFPPTPDTKPAGDAPKGAAAKARARVAKPDPEPGPEPKQEYIPDEPAEDPTKGTSRACYKCGTSFTTDPFVVDMPDGDSAFCCTADCAAKLIESFGTA